MISAVTPIAIEGTGADAAGAGHTAALPGTASAHVREAAPSGFGVNLDEDVMRQIRRQNSHTAVAKMITATDDMLRAILGMTL